MPSPQSSSTPPRAATAKSAVRPGGRTTTVGATSATGPSPVAVNCSSTAANSSATTAAAVVRGDGTAMGATARVAHRLLCLQRPTNPTDNPPDRHTSAGTNDNLDPHSNTGGTNGGIHNVPVVSGAQQLHNGSTGNSPSGSTGGVEGSAGGESYWMRRGVVALDSSGLRIAESGAVPVRAGAIVSVFRHAACLRPNAQIPPIVCIETTETSIIAAHEDGITIAVFDSATPLAHRTGNAKYDVPRQSTVATS
eukprot:Lankesteria_metandrocarpae@DN2226_c0_g1_i1.p1